MFKTAANPGGLPIDVFDGLLRDEGESYAETKLALRQASEAIREALKPGK